MMPNQRNSISYGILLLCVITVSSAGKRLVNDTCQTVLNKNDSNKFSVKVVCNELTEVFDPKSQNGSYIFDNGTQNWVGEIFACLCSCHLPVKPNNGQLLSENQIRHGEVLNYSCDNGYKKKMEKKIVCYDGILMAVPENFEPEHINITSFRQKSLQNWFAIEFNKVYDLQINDTANWSISENEVQKNQKVFESYTVNETIVLYMFNGSSYMLLGYIDVEKGGGLQCIPGTKIPSPNMVEVIIPLVVVVIFLIAALLIAFAIRKKRRSHKFEKPHLEIQSEQKPMRASEEKGEDDS